MQNIIIDSSMTTEQVKAYLAPKLPDLDDSLPWEYIENAAVLFELHHRGKSAADYFRTAAHIGFFGGSPVKHRYVHVTYDLLKDLVPASDTRPGVYADAAEAFAEHFERGEQLDEIRETEPLVYEGIGEVLNGEEEFDVCELSTVLVRLLSQCDTNDENAIYRFAYTTLLDDLSKLPGTDEDELCESIRTGLNIITAVRKRVGTSYRMYPLLCKAAVMLRALTDYEEERSYFEHAYDFFDDEDDFDYTDLDGDLSGSFSDLDLSDLDLDDYFEDDDFDDDDYDEE